MFSVGSFSLINQYFSLAMPLFTINLSDLDFSQISFIHTKGISLSAPFRGRATPFVKIQLSSIACTLSDSLLSFPYTLTARTKCVENSI